MGACPPRQGPAGLRTSPCALPPCPSAALSRPLCFPRTGRRPSILPFASSGRPENEVFVTRSATRPPHSAPPAGVNSPAAHNPRGGQGQGGVSGRPRLLSWLGAERGFEGALLRGTMPSSEPAGCRVHTLSTTPPAGVVEVTGRPLQVGQAGGQPWECRAREAGPGLLGLRRLELLLLWAEGCPEPVAGRAEKPAPTSRDQSREAEGRDLGSVSELASGPEHTASRPAAGDTSWAGSSLPPRVFQADPTQNRSLSRASARRSPHSAPSPSLCPHSGPARPQPRPVHSPPAQPLAPVPWEEGGGALPIAPAGAEGLGPVAE